MHIFEIQHTAKFMGEPMFHYTRAIPAEFSDQALDLYISEFSEPLPADDDFFITDHGTLEDIQESDTGHDLMARIFTEARKYGSLDKFSADRMPSDPQFAKVSLFNLCGSLAEFMWATGFRFRYADIFRHPMGRYATAARECFRLAFDRIEAATAAGLLPEHGPLYRLVPISSIDWDDTDITESIPA